MTLSLHPVLFIWSVWFVWSDSFNWFVWFVLFIWLNQTNQTDQVNQMNQTDQTCLRRAAIVFPQAPSAITLHDGDRVNGTL